MDKYSNVQYEGVQSNGLHHMFGIILIVKIDESKGIFLK